MKYAQYERKPDTIQTKVISVEEHEKKIKKLEDRLKKVEEATRKPTYSRTWAEVYPDGNYPE